jgi:SAM-dependent methyltransferase
MSVLIKLLKKLPWVADFVKSLDNQNIRTEWVKKELSSLPANSILLDAGCGSQQYRKFCRKLTYKAQDFASYVRDDKKTINGDSDSYQYGELDYVGDIWSIDESDLSFDAILCTEVFEHIPHPIKTLEEFSRLMKPNGILILTAPSACLRHMDPYFFYSGFTDRWYEKFLPENGFEIESIEPVGDYYSWLGVEMVRTSLTHSIVAKILLLPAIFYYRSKKRTETSINTLCMGYHIRAKKL